MSKKKQQTAETEEENTYDLLRSKYREIRTEMLILNFALIILGLVMVIIPAKFNEFIGQILGCALCIWGVLRCITFLRLKKEEAFGSNALVQGAAMLGFGIFFLVQPDRFGNLLNSLLVLAVLIAAVYKLQNAINYYKLRISRWWLHFIAAGILLALGIIALIRPGRADDEAGLAVMITIIIGTALIISGVWDLFAVSILSKKLKKTVREMEEEGIIPEVSGKGSKRDKKFVRISEKDVTDKSSGKKRGRTEERTEFRDPELDEIDDIDYGDDFDEDKTDDKKGKK